MRRVMFGRAAAKFLICGVVLCVTLGWPAVESFAQQKTEAKVTQASSIRREVPSFGRVEVSTNPGNYPLLIDGQQAGATSPAVRALDLAPGKHTVEIIFPNGRRWARELNVAAGRKQCINLNYKPRPACALTVGAPAQVGEGSLITFTSEVVDAGAAPLNYQWSVSPSSARIVGGQGTPTITVDSTGAGGAQVTAILNVAADVRDPLCRCQQTAQKATSVISTPPPVIGPRRFDEFPSLSFDDDKARLDNFAIELQNTPGAIGYVIVYGNRAARSGEAARLGARAQDYLVNLRGIDADRVKVINAGPRDRAAFELWVVPRGAKLPSPVGR